MTRPALAAAALALWAACGLPARTSAQPLSLLAPVDGAVVHSPDVLVVFTVATGTRIACWIDGKPAAVPDVPVPGDHADLHHVRVGLKEGRQVVRLLDAADESELARVRLTYIPPYSLRTAAADDDVPYRFHTRDREASCSGCHSLPEVFETLSDRPLAPAGKVCGACHPGVETAPYLHGPVAVYACFMCHEPEYAPARFGQKGSQPASCATCHEGFLAKVLGGKKYVHGPVAAGGCLVCHDPHGGKTGALVRDKPPQLCLRCHADTLPLPVTRNLHGRVPCARCHDAHGGQTAALTAQEGNDFCGQCHRDVADTGTGHPVEGHPVSGALDPSRPGRRLGCPSCHTAHAPDDVARQRLPADEAARKAFCRRCHY
ncbi:MAG: hypothetical protein Kow0092_06260 [Deferrisomatales bacterium]